MRIRNQCRACGLPFGVRVDRKTTTVDCPNCDESQTVDTDGWAADNDESIEYCLLCGCRHLYRQRDINRALGCALVAIGAVLVPWTYGLSLVVLAAVDLVLFYRLKEESVVCYRCDAVYRDAHPSPRQNEFDLLKHDVLKYGKSWSELAPAQGMALDDAIEDGRESEEGRN